MTQEEAQQNWIDQYMFVGTVMWYGVFFPRRWTDREAILPRQVGDLPVGAVVVRAQNRESDKNEHAAFIRVTHGRSVTSTYPGWTKLQPWQANLLALMAYPFLPEATF